MKNNKIITYFFLFGRLKRINDEKPYPVEMFYGYQYLKSKFLNVSMIEAEPTAIRTFIQNNIEHRIGHILKIPILFSYFTSIKNYLIIRKSDILIFSNHRALISSYPMLLVNKLFGKSFVSIVFFMGLLNKFPKNVFLYKFKIYFIKNILKFSSKIYFLNKAELVIANELFPEFENIFEYYPFSVDLDFWKNKNQIKSNDVLFIGNDGQRNYEIVINLVNKLPNTSFTIVSKFIDKNKIKNKHCKIIEGSWDGSLLSDLDILDLYNKSKVTIIPLKDSLQPSGQSVALQSMACGTPVIISKTKGFWDNENLIDNKNIFLISNNNLKNWIENINLVLNFSNEKYNSYSSSCEAIVNQQYSMDNINFKLESFINNL